MWYGLAIANSTATIIGFPARKGSTGAIGRMLTTVAESCATEMKTEHNNTATIDGIVFMPFIIAENSH
jgi:hypothetical protein